VIGKYIFLHSDPGRVESPPKSPKQCSDQSVIEYSGSLSKISTTFEQQEQQEQEEEQQSKNSKSSRLEGYELAGKN
jgi:hypothetical protein